tara:strand:+ start:516 stop:767 length:252 start_codon:yes stop_codon:yes gene_type:complete
MSKEKCHLEGMPWDRHGSVEVCVRSSTLGVCKSCTNRVCNRHRSGLLGELCDKCYTLQDLWLSADNKEFFNEIYGSMTKACRE